MDLTIYPGRRARIGSWGYDGIDEPAPVHHLPGWGTSPTRDGRLTSKASDVDMRAAHDVAEATGADPQTRE